MSTAILLADGSSPIALGIRQTLQDWAAVGLLRRFLWVDKAAVVADSGSPVQALLVDGDRSQRVDVSDWMSLNSETLGSIRAFVIQLPDSVEHIDVSVAEQLIYRVGLHSSHCDLLNVIAPSLVERPSVTTPWRARLNLLIQPVDSIEPGSSTHQLLYRGHENFATHVASGLACLAGLWRGMDAPAVSVIEDGMIADARVTVTRCFVGMIDGSATLAGLRDSLRSGDGLPAPYSGSGQLIPLDRSRAAAEVRRAAEELVAGHDELRFTPPEDFRPPPKVKVPLRQVLKDFFGFLVASARGIPRRWYKRMTDQVAGGLTHMFYGDNSAYQVILRPVGIEQTDLVENLASGVAEASGQFGAPPLSDTSHIWRSVNETATGLIDGSDLPDGVRPPLEGGERAVITDPALIAPDPRVAGTKVGYGVVAGAGEIPISTQDPLSALMARELVEDEKARTVQGSPNAAVLATTGEALDRFIDQQPSLIWQFQQLLAEQVQTARAELRRAVAGDAANLNDMLTRVGAAQHAAVTFVRRMVLALMILFAVIVLLIVLPVLTLVVGIIVLVLVVFGWFGATVWGYFNRQRLLYQLLHEANLIPLRDEWARLAQLHLQGELNRLVSLYRQGRLWSGIYARSVHSIFGAEDEAQTAGSRIGMLSGQLPLHMRIGKADFDPRSQSQLPRELRRSLFGVGWFATRLHRRFELALDAAGGAPEMVQRLWNDQGTNSTYPLQLVAQHIGDATVRDAARAELTVSIVDWARTRQSGEAGSAWLSEQLMPSVQLLAGRLPNERSRSSSFDFVMRMLDPGDPQPTLPPEGFTAKGLTRNAPALTRPAVASYASGLAGWCHLLATSSEPAVIGLDQLAVRVDFTKPLDVSDLIFTDSEPPISLRRERQPVSRDDVVPDDPWVPRAPG